MHALHRGRTAPGAPGRAGIGRVVCDLGEKGLREKIGAHEESPTLDLSCEIVFRPDSVRPKSLGRCSRTRRPRCKRTSGKRGTLTTRALCHLDKTGCTCDHPSELTDFRWRISN